MAANKGDVAWNVSIPPELAEEMRALAGELGRSIRDETIAAMRRHLAARPTISSPPLPGEVLAPPVPSEKPKRKRSSKPKA